MGTVAAGLAYLAMIRDGYHWVDHFENANGGNPAVRRSPDFAFAGKDVGMALVESKGTLSAGRSAFDSRVEAGYLRQVEPHLGHPVDGMLATHGYCHGAWLTSTTKAEMLIHHTAVSTTMRDEGGAADQPTEIQQQNYATAFQLVQGPEMSAQLRRGFIREPQPFLRFRWLGRTWLTSSLSVLPWFWEPAVYQSAHRRRPWPLLDAFSPPSAGFAMEEANATAVFRYFSTPQRDEGFGLGVEPLSPELIAEARTSYDGQGGAVFPDGLAVIGWQNWISDREIVNWNGENFSVG